MLNQRLLIVIALLFFVLSVYAQNTGNSPYSTIGIGDMNTPALIRNIGMGGTGIGNPHAEFINIQNPALLSVNKNHNRDSTIKYTQLEAGFTGQLRQLSTESKSQQSRGFNINYINIALPVSQHWTTSIGIRPFTAVQNRAVTVYTAQDSLRVLNDNAYRGSLNQVHFANGFDLSKHISVGLLAAYLFGNITQENVSQTATSNSVLAKAGVRTRTSYSGFEFKPGISYRGTLKNPLEGKPGTYLNLGITYDLFPGMNAKVVKDYILKDGSDGTVNFNDSLVTRSEKTVRLAPALGIGLSINTPDRWTIAADFTTSNWSQFQSTQTLNPGVTIQNSQTIALGFEFNPSKTIALTNKELRAGVAYTKSHIAIYGKQLNDFSATIGGTLPLGRKDQRFKSRPLTKINIAFVAGARGTTANGYVREQYFKIYLGALIHDKWFQRWKID